MKHTIWITLALILFSTSTFAQDYDLNTYKYRFQKYKGLTTDFRYTNNGNNRFQSSQIPAIDRNQFSNNQGIYSDLNVNLRYFSFLNEDDLQESVSLYVEDGVSQRFSSVNSSDNNEYNSRAFANRLVTGYDKSVRRYAGNKFKYRRHQGSMVGRVERTSGHQSKKEVSSRSGNLLNADYGYSLGRGKGRLDDVTDAVSAYFLLQDLRQKTGVSYTSEQLEDVAKGITRIIRQRYLDSRIGKIRQLTALDSVLGAEGLRGESNMAYFSTLNDNWNYAYRIHRSTGKQWTYYYTQGATVLLDNQKSFGKGSKNEYGHTRIKNPGVSGAYTVAYDNYSQKSMKIQKSYGFKVTPKVSFAAIYYVNRSDTLPLTYPIKSGDPALTRNGVTSLSAYWSRLYQPTSRNIFVATVRPSVNIDHQSLSSELLKDWDANSFGVNSDISLNLAYYRWVSSKLYFKIDFNPRVSNSSSFFLNIRDNRAQDTNIDYSTSARLVYQLF